MKVFLSWSGAKSNKIAKAFSDWLPCVIQAAEPWFSEKDIDRGSVWFNEIYKEIADCDLGVVFVTKENQLKPWLLFEAGALSRGLTERRVCTVLTDLTVREVDSGSPLRQLNHTGLVKKDVLELVHTINKSLDQGGVKEDVLERAFEALWPDFEAKIEAIKNEIPAQEDPEDESSDDDVLNDILDRVLGIERTLSRTARNSQYIPQEKANQILKELLDLGCGREQITELLQDIVPSMWLRRRVRRYFGKDEDNSEENES